MVIQFQYIAIIPMAALLILNLSGVGHASSDFSQSPDQVITIELIADSSPRFFECGITPTNGTTTITGFNPTESAQTVLTDGNPDTAIMGDARFIVSFSDPLLNLPGPELSVIELSSAESFNSSADISNFGENPISVTPQSGNMTNSCNYIINEAQIDLDYFGIDEGSSVDSVSFNNLGAADSLLGADISDISILQTSENDTNSSTSDDDSDTNSSTSDDDSDTSEDNVQ